MNNEQFWLKSLFEYWSRILSYSEKKSTTNKQKFRKIKIRSFQTFSILVIQKNVVLQLKPFPAYVHREIVEDSFLPPSRKNIWIFVSGNVSWTGVPPDTNATISRPPISSVTGDSSTFSEVKQFTYAVDSLKEVGKSYSSLVLPSKLDRSQF